MASNQLVRAVSTVTGEHRTVPENWLEESGPFPGQWTAEGAPAPEPAAPTPAPATTPEPPAEDGNDKSEED